MGQSEKSMYLGNLLKIKAIIMENEHKDKKVILTDEELKEVAGGGGQTLSLVTGCSNLPQYYCVQKMTCTWDIAKKLCVIKPKS